METEGVAFPEYGRYSKNIDLQAAYFYDPAWSTPTSTYQADEDIITIAKGNG